MNGIIKAILVEFTDILGELYFKMIPKISFGWSSGKYGTHSLLTKKAIEQVKSAGVDSVNVLHDQNANIVAESSLMPDFDEKEKANAGHFYNPETGKSFLKSSKTAKDNFIKHANTALKEYKKGNQSDAMQELGRACHYLEDMGQPQHVSTSNTLEAATNLKNHKAFEAYVGENQISFKYTPINKSEISKIKNKNFDESIEEIFDETANASLKRKSDTDKDNQVNWFACGESMLDYTKNQTAKFIARFILEIEKPVNIYQKTYNDITEKFKQFVSR